MSPDRPTPTGPISPIRVRPGDRYFVDASGSPVFWLGDTQWELFRHFTVEEARQVLEDRRAKGFNVILVMLTGVAGDGKAPLPNLDGEVPWIDGDPARPNEKYFQHVDTVIRLGEQTNQVFVVGVYHKWHIERFPPETARVWARWVAQRYRSVPNLIWSMYPEAKDEYIPVCRALASGLQEGDEGAHLISVHPDPSVASSSFIHDEPWLPFNMIQPHNTYDRIYDTVTADYQLTPIKPVVMAEAGYEGAGKTEPITPLAIRRQAYWSQLAGGHHVYGHDQAYRSPRDWKQHIDSPGARHIAVFKDVITSCDGWWEMVPDQSIFASGEGSGYTLNMAARSPRGLWILAYLSGPATVSLHLDALCDGNAHATWVDPTRGDRLAAGKCAMSGTQSFTSPEGWDDAVLLIEAE